MIDHRGMLASSINALGGEPKDAADMGGMLPGRRTGMAAAPDA
jgi:hypothetical protein